MPNPPQRAGVETSARRGARNTVRDFDLARYAFVESIDVIAGLDSRPDLTSLTPTEFEHFVRQLFEARGLEGWTTERTGDDGVDAVAINRDPWLAD